MSAIGGFPGALAFAWVVLCWLGYQIYANY
jgi:hypothetical protein